MDETWKTNEERKNKKTKIKKIHNERKMGQDKKGKKVKNLYDT